MSLAQTQNDLRKAGYNLPFGGTSGSTNPRGSVYDPRLSHDDNILRIHEALKKGILDPNSIDATFLTETEDEISLSILDRKH